MVDSIVSAIAAAYLLTAIFALKFQYWKRPGLLAIYFIGFGTLEWVAFHYLIPKDAFGPWLTRLSFFLGTVVIIAIILVHRYEQKHERPSNGHDPS